jgi:hypothetical protein
MMSQRIDGFTRVIGKAQGYNALWVRDETILDAVNGPDTPVMVTSWQPTPLELARLRAGAPVIIRLLGTAHPPILVDAGEGPPWLNETGESTP